jgi:hypothetical protein
LLLLLLCLYLDDNTNEREQQIKRLTSLLRDAHAAIPILHQNDVKMLIEIYGIIGTEAVLRAWTMREKEYLQEFVKLTAAPKEVPSFFFDLCDTKRVHTSWQAWANCFSKKGLQNSWNKSKFEAAAAAVDAHFKTDPPAPFKFLRGILANHIHGCGKDYGSANLARILYMKNGWYCSLSLYLCICPFV